MEFMKNVPSQEVVEIFVYHRGKNLVRKGIAP